MATVERTITVPTPLGTVWDYVTDFTSTEEWDPPTQRCTKEAAAGQDGKGVGTEYLNVSKVAGKDTEIRYTVTEYEPQRRLQLRGEMTAMHLLDTITFDGDASGTTLTYHAEFEPVGVAKLIEPLLPLGLKRLGDKTSDSLEERLRSLAGGGSALG